MLLWSLLIQEGLQNQDSRHLIDDLPVVLPFSARLVQNPVRLVAGQPLVPQVDRQPGQLSQFRCKCLCLYGLRAQFTGDVQWIANYDSNHSVPARQPSERAQIFSPAPSPLQSHHRLRCKPQLIRHRHADATVAYVQPQIPRNCFSLQLRFSSCSVWPGGKSQCLELLHIDTCSCPAMLCRVPGRSFARYNRILRVLAVSASV